MSKCNTDAGYDAFCTTERLRRFEPGEINAVDYAWSDITRSLICGVRVSIKRLAVSPEHFQERFEESAQELGYAQRPILIPGLARFKAIIVVDGGQWPRGEGIMEF